MTATRPWQGQLGSGSGMTCRLTCECSFWLASSSRQPVVRGLLPSRSSSTSKVRHHRANAGTTTATTTATTAAASTASSSRQQGLRLAQTTAVVHSVQAAL